MPSKQEKKTKYVLVSGGEQHKRMPQRILLLNFLQASSAAWGRALLV